MSNANDITWDQTIWDAINSAALNSIKTVRVAQKAFPTVPYDSNPTQIIDSVIDLRSFSLKEGRTKPLVTIYREFQLTSTQADKELDGNYCKTLACQAAKAVGLAEDTVIFAGDVRLPSDVKSDLLDSAKQGLLGEAAPADSDDNDPDKVSRPIDVALTGRPGVLYGENLFSAVALAISKVLSKGQSGPYALFLPPRVRADSYVPPSPASLVTTAESVIPLLEDGGHFLQAVALPQDKGLFAALAADPVTLHLGLEIAAEFIRSEGSNRFLRVFERIQYVVTEPRALVLLKFEQAAGPHPAGKGRQ